MDMTQSKRAAGAFTTADPVSFCALPALLTATIHESCLQLPLLILLKILPALFFTKSIFFQPWSE
jgi:hypothetical protein